MPVTEQATKQMASVIIVQVQLTEVGNLAFQKEGHHVKG